MRTDWLLNFNLLFRTLIVIGWKKLFRSSFLDQNQHCLFERAKPILFKLCLYAKLVSNRKNVWTWKRRKNQGQEQDQIYPRWTSISSWPCPPFLEKRTLCQPNWIRSSSLLSCRPRILVCWNLGVGWQCCPWQQESKNHPKTSSTRNPKRWRVEQTFVWSDHCQRRCPAKHSHDLVAKEARQAEEVDLTLSHKTAIFIATHFEKTFISAASLYSLYRQIIQYSLYRQIIQFPDFNRKVNLLPSARHLSPNLTLLHMH